MEWPITKAGLGEKDVKSNWQPIPPSFDGFDCKTLLFLVLKAS